MKKKIDLRTRMREIKFTTENHLTEEQLRKLIQEKYERARALRDNMNPRESNSQKIWVLISRWHRKRDPATHSKQLQMGGLGDGVLFVEQKIRAYRSILDEWIQSVGIQKKQSGQCVSIHALVSVRWKLWAVGVVGGTRALQAWRNGSIPLRSTMFISVRQRQSSGLQNLEVRVRILPGMQRFLLGIS